MKEVGATPRAVPLFLDSKTAPWEVAILGCVTAVLLNQSAIVGGINFSLADPFLVMALVALAVFRGAVLPRQIAIFFCALVTITVVTASWIVPFQFGIVADASAIIADLAKLVVCLLYLICGASLAAAGIHMQVLRWFTIGAAAVAVTGVLLQITGASFLSETLYYAGVRFRGFMIDPNYWAVLSCAALAFLVRDTRWKPRVRVPLICAIAAAILLSGSKTGLIVMLALFALITIEYVFRSGRVALGSLVTALSLGLAVSWSTLVDIVGQAVSRNTDAFPQVARLVPLLQDPMTAVAGDGSGRLDTWENGLEIIAHSPVVGVGVGSYGSVSNALFGELALAHNTYLQISAEWGLPLAAVFFVWLALVIGGATAAGWGPHRVTEALMVRDMAGVFLLGSLSLSLNNARMFWFFLGILIVVGVASRKASKSRRSGHDDAITHSFNGVPAGEADYSPSESQLGVPGQDVGGIGDGVRRTPAG